MVNIHKFIGQDGMLAGVMERVLSIILERLWWLGEISDSWEKANVTSVFKKSRKGDQGGAACSASP